MMCGGYGEVKVADAEIQKLAETVRDEVENKLGSKYQKFDVVSYTSQVVAGTNYKIKVNVGDSYVHLKVFKPLPHTGSPPELNNAEGRKTLEDEL